jgi:integrase
LRAVKTRTFRQCAEAYIEANRAGWKNERQARQLENTLVKYAFPIIGGLSVADIDTGLVLDVLTQKVDTAGGKAPLWNARPPTAAILRARIENILQYARVHNLREGDNPADWKLLKYTLPAKNKVYREGNFAALPYVEIGAFMADLRSRAGIAARALEFAILTATRSNEVRFATWDEIDISARLWVIPAGRMKTGREHHVPLSEAAIRLLEALPRHEGNDLVFPAARAAQLPVTALLTLIQRMHESKLAADGRGWVDPKQNNRIITAHGFRSTFGDWAGDMTHYQYEVRQHAIAHDLPNKSDGAYFRSDQFIKRVGLMEEWSRYCDRLKAGTVTAEKSPSF